MDTFPGAVTLPEIFYLSYLPKETPRGFAVQENKQKITKKSPFRKNEGESTVCTCSPYNIVNTFIEGQSV